MEHVEGGAAGGVVSTADDMHAFIKALTAGRLFRSPGTLALMRETVPTGAPGEGYGLGLKTTAPGFRGQSGQTMGYLSIIEAAEGRDVSAVAWASTSMNPFALGATDIADALSRTGTLHD